MSFSMINHVLNGAVNTPNSVDAQIQIAMKSIQNLQTGYRNRVMFRILILLIILFICATSITQSYYVLGVILVAGVVILLRDYSKYSNELAVIDAELSALYTLAERFRKK